MVHPRRTRAARSTQRIGRRSKVSTRFKHDSMTVKLTEVLAHYIQLIKIKVSQRKMDMDLEKKAWDRHSHPKVSMESQSSLDPI
jgi:hypothetical protein